MFFLSFLFFTFPFLHSARSFISQTPAFNFPHSSVLMLISSYSHVLLKGVSFAFHPSIHPFQFIPSVSSSSYRSCLYGRPPSFSVMICSLSRHRFSPNSSSCACLDGSVTLRSGMIFDELEIMSVGIARGRRRRSLFDVMRWCGVGLTYCPWILSLTTSSLVAANKADRHP